MGNLMTICMMTMVHHTMFRHTKKMKTAIGTCSIGKQLSNYSNTRFCCRVMVTFHYCEFHYCEKYVRW